MTQEEKRKYWRDWYHKNKPRQKHRIVENERKRRIKIRAWINKQKEGRTCQRCPFSDPRALEWHHRDRKSKLFNIGESASAGYAIPKIEIEIQKCDLLCANCHSIEHSIWLVS